MRWVSSLPCNSTHNIIYCRRSQIRNIKWMYIAYRKRIYGIIMNFGGHLGSLEIRKNIFRYIQFNVAQIHCCIQQPRLWNWKYSQHINWVKSYKYIDIWWPFWIYVPYKIIKFCIIAIWVNYCANVCHYIRLILLNISQICTFIEIYWYSAAFWIYWSLEGKFDLPPLLKMKLMTCTNTGKSFML